MAANDFVEVKTPKKPKKKKRMDEITISMWNDLVKRVGNLEEEVNFR